MVVLTIASARIARPQAGNSRNVNGGLEFELLNEPQQVYSVTINGKPAGMIQHGKPLMVVPPVTVEGMAAAFAEYKKSLANGGPAPTPAAGGDGGGGKGEVPATSVPNPPGVRWVNGAAQVQLDSRLLVSIKRAGENLIHIDVTGGSKPISFDYQTASGKGTGSKVWNQVASNVYSANTDGAVQANSNGSSVTIIIHSDVPGVPDVKRNGAFATGRQAIQDRERPAVEAAVDAVVQAADIAENAAGRPADWNLKGKDFKRDANVNRKTIF
jgi:hypothetical protein